MNTDYFKTTLLQRKKELEEHSAKTKETRAPVELDQTVQGRLSRQDAMMQQSMALATDRKRSEEIQRIDAALERLETDNFGYCVTCDEEISKARLTNDPAVPTCINCAK